MQLRIALSALLASSSITTTAFTLDTDSPRRIARDYDAHDYYVLQFPDHINPRDAASELDLHYDGPLALDDHHVFRRQHQHGYNHIHKLKRDLGWRRQKRDPIALQPHILDDIWHQKQELHKRFPLEKRSIPSRQSGNLPPSLDQGDGALEAIVQEGLAIAKNLSIVDPIFQEQWHLHNHVEVGHDINVTGVWLQNVTGRGSTVCIVDDGLDFHSGDLKDNYFAKGSWDYNDPGPDPLPRLSDDRHGTRCAGEIAAGRNDVCGLGVAYEGKVAGVRILSRVISDADEAEAMIYEYQQNQIYSCSWGPPDDGTAMEAPGILIKKAMVQGIQKGRGGLGSIYVFAIGNGASNDDNCNFDGYTNSIYSVSVGGIDRQGKHPYYSEKCSAQLVVTYSSGSGDAIHTTDVGENQCYNNHGGTSAAGPLVAGIYALMMEVSPHLSWRDIQWLTVMTAVKLDEQSDYQMNQAVGKEFSHQFGYGKADAYALVEAARTWKSVKPQAWYYSPWQHVDHALPQGEQGLASSFEVTADMLKEANLERVEHVTITMNVAHTRRGDLSAELISPSGMVSQIATHRRNDNANSGYVDWTFMSVAHWGESGIGKWIVVLKDTRVNEHNGTFTNWHLKLFGECIDAEHQLLLPIPTTHDDDDAALALPTHTATFHTTSVAVPTETGTPVGNPTDHHDRPTKPTATASPSPLADQEPEEGEEANPPSDSSNLLPHPFPTFGVSKKTQTWIYGSLALILLFLMCLAGWIIYYRRKKRWARGDYDFEMVDHEDVDDGDETGLLANGRRKKRGNELYTPFAEARDEFELGSSEEDEDDEGRRTTPSSSDEGGRGTERYRDREPMREGTDVG